MLKIVNNKPTIETTVATTNNGNFPSISGEYNPLGSKLIKRAI
jgi:hypothetical protein